MMTINEITISNNTYPTNEELAILDRYEIETPSLGHDGEEYFIVNEYLPNWEEFRKIVKFGKFYVINFNKEHCEFLYEVPNEEEAKKVFEIAVRELEDNEDMIDETYIFSGFELIDYIDKEIEYLRD